MILETITVTVSDEIMNKIVLTAVLLVFLYHAVRRLFDWME